MNPGPSADDVRKEDLRVEVLRVPTPLPGPSVVRLTHLPTGIVVTSDAYPSSLQAKAHALHLLRVALAHIDGPKRSRCDVVGHDWRPKMDGPECLRCGARNDGQEVGPCPVCGWLIDTEECRSAPEHSDGEVCDES